MTIVQIVVIATVYLLSFAGLVLYADIGLAREKITVTDYQRTFVVAQVPVVNTLALALCLASALVHFLSFGMWNKSTK